MDEQYDEIDDLIYYFVGDNELLELINSDSSYTMNDENSMTTLEGVFNINNETNNYQGITFWDTTKITTMERMFFQKKQFNELLLWNTKNVKDMSYMFFNASSFNQPLEFNTKNVVNMSYMFFNASSFNQPLKFNIENVVSMSYMFNNSKMEKCHLETHTN